MLYKDKALIIMILSPFCPSNIFGIFISMRRSISNVENKLWKPHRNPVL